MFDFHNKTFRITLIEGQDTEVNEDTQFHFQQDGNIIWATYSGGKVKRGQLVGIITGKRLIHQYVQINLEDQINSGKGGSYLQYDEKDRIQIIEEWEWENKPGSGRSVMTEQSID